MSRPISTTVTIVAGAATGIALSQSLGAAGALALNGALTASGVATFDAPRRVAIFSSGNDTSLIWSVTGTLRPEMNSIPITETLAGGSGTTVYTVNDFATVTSIAGSKATAGTAYAGTNGVASGPWVVLSGFSAMPQVSLGTYLLSGSPTFSVEYTLDDVLGGAFVTPQTPYPRPVAVTGLSAVNTSTQGNFQLPARAVRLTLTAAPGSVQLITLPQGT